MDTLKKAVVFLSGKKTYIVSVGALMYAIGIQRGWWPHSADVDLMFGGTGLITVRMAIAKLCQQIQSDAGIQPGDKLFGQEPTTTQRDVGVASPKQ